AEPLFQRALYIKEQSLGEQHPSTAEVLHSFGVLREAQGNAQEAASLYQRALDIREQTLGPQHSETVATRAAYAVALRALGRDSEAARLEAARESASSSMDPALEEALAASHGERWTAKTASQQALPLLPPPTVLSLQQLVILTPLSEEVRD